MKKMYIGLFLLLVVALLTSGCYYKREVSSSEVGLRMDDGVKVSAVVGPGRYTDMGYYADLKRMDVSAKTLSWEDPDLVTMDKQPIGLQVGITYARSRDADKAKLMWELYNGEAGNDELLAAQVLNRIPRVAKAITTKFTLDQMLGIGAGGDDAGRMLVQSEIYDELEKELAELNVDLLDVGINNISPSSTYMGLLEDKANAQVQVEVSQQRTKQLQEQLAQERAQTDIEVEQARRKNLVAQEEAKILTTNERWFELQKLDRMANIFGERDKVWFITPGTDLTLLLGSNGSMVTPGQ